MGTTWILIYVVIGWIIRLAMIPTVLRREFAPGAAIAWLGIVFLHPYIGLTLYWTVGETRLGPRRAARHRAIIHRFRGQGRQSIRPELHREYEPMVLQAEKISGLPIVGRNNVEFIGNSEQMIRQLIADITAATSQIHLLYYIFACDSSGQRVIAAVKAAAARGVKCRMLLDAVASRAFFRHKDIVSDLTSAGVEIAAALPVAPLRRELPRVDLRNHRKLAIIDSEIAFVGSQNVINADYGGRRGGPWVDLTARFTGPVVNELAGIFAEDWAFETGKELPIPQVVDADDDQATIPAQVVPTGPSTPGDSFRRVLLAAVQCAREQVTLTTPYFVPDEPTLLSLLMAADRGVEVTLIVPQKPDHPFTAAAGRAHYGRLMEAGVKIFQYRPGLIHAKSTTVDDAFATIGSANLDVRSFNLNFELSVLLYGSEITKRLWEIQQGYLADSVQIDPVDWSRRPILRQYAERALSLLSPLL